MVLSTHPKDFLLELVIEKIKSTTNHFSKIQYHFYFIFFHVVHSIGYWCSLHPWINSPKSMREHGVANHFWNIGGSTARVTYRPIWGHNILLTRGRVQIIHLNHPSYIQLTIQNFNIIMWWGKIIFYPIGMKLNLLW